MKLGLQSRVEKRREEVEDERRGAEMKRHIG